MIRSKIRVRLAELDKRQSEVYAKMGITPQQFSNWVQGKSMPYLETAFRLAKELDCKVDDLWELQDDMNE